MRVRSTVSLVTAAVVLLGCSGEDIAENVLEDRIEAESGEDVDIDFDDGDISIRSEDGEFTLEVDEDDGNVSISGSSDDGEFTIESEDGETVIETEDGETIIGSTGGELPDDFPASIPLPNGFDVQYAQSIAGPDGQTFIVGGAVDGTPTDVLDEYVAVLEDAGFDRQQLTSTAEGGFFGYDDGEYAVSGGIGSEGEAASFLTITVGPSLQG